MKIINRPISSGRTAVFKEDNYILQKEEYEIKSGITLHSKSGEILVTITDYEEPYNPSTYSRSSFIYNPSTHKTIRVQVEESINHNIISLAKVIAGREKFVVLTGGRFTPLKKFRGMASRGMELYFFWDDRNVHPVHGTRIQPYINVWIHTRQKDDLYLHFRDVRRVNLGGTRQTKVDLIKSLNMEAYNLYKDCTHGQICLHLRHGQWVIKWQFSSIREEVGLCKA